MKTRVTVLLLCAALCSTVAFSQWTYLKTFHRGGTLQVHGVAVSPDNRVWIGAYGRTGDSLGGFALRNVTILSPDSTPAPFSPIRTLTVAGIIDTLKEIAAGSGACRGLNSASDGNILYSFYDRLYKINYRTGAAITRVIPAAGQTLTMASSTSLATGGDIIVGRVASGSPIYIYDSNLGSLGSVTDATVQLSRTAIVSPNGNDVYHGAVAGGGVLKYHSNNGTLGPYVLTTDTVAKINFSESLQWDKRNPSILWTSSRDAYPPYSKNTWYAFNVNTRALVDSIKWRTGGPDSVGTPRGIAFSVSGDTAYAAAFDGHSVQMFRRGSSSVEPVVDVIPTAFTLSQNYPNPFNPTTEIQFTITQSGATTLVVYDMLGRTVATLVNESLRPGAYVATFNASNLPSGTYVCRLSVNNRSLSKKMMVLK